MKYLLKYIYLKLLIKFSPHSKLAIIYRKYYGVRIGKNVRFSSKEIYFGSEPFLIEIGDDCVIGRGIKFITHDGASSIFRKNHPGLNVFGKIKIGNSVFVGEDTMIFLGVTIGDNVIIGARSVVTKDIPSNAVVAGMPAKEVNSYENYIKKAVERGIYIFERDPIKRKNEILEKLKEKASD